MLLLLLFPVISVTDDIWAAHNPAETDTTLRRNNIVAHPQTIVPPIADLPIATGFAFSQHLAGSHRIAQRQYPNIQAISRLPLYTRPPPAL